MHGGYRLGEGIEGKRVEEGSVSAGEASFSLVRGVGQFIKYLGVLR